MEQQLAKSRRKHGDGDAHRRCGDCTLCCTVMGVVDHPAGEKRPNVQCPDVCSRGCRIYSDRPQSCRDFACLWVQGGLPKWMKPNRIGVVFVCDQRDDLDIILGHVDPRTGHRWLQNQEFVDYMTALGKRPGIRVGMGISGSNKVSHQFGPTGMIDRPIDLDQPAPGEDAG